MKYLFFILISFNSFANLFECEIVDNYFNENFTLQVDLYEYEDQDLLNRKNTKAKLLYVYESQVNYINFYLYDGTEFHKPDEGKIINKGIEFPQYESFEWKQEFLSKTISERRWNVWCRTI